MRRNVPISLAATAICLAALTAVSAPAYAEGGLLGAIFNAIGRAIAPPAPLRGDSSDGPSNALIDAFGLNKTEVRPSEGGPQVSFCVRSCDGRYFPIAKSGEASPAKTCQAMCPTAQTEIFSGSNIENAVSPRGTRYSSLANAYVYREKLVDGCTCNGRSAAGTARIDYLNDATLRPGDIVMTETGAVVFRGTPGPTHKLSDFVPAQDSRRISNATREKVVAMKLMPTRQVQARANRPEQRAATAAQAAAAIDQAPHTNVRTLGFVD